MTRSTVRTSTRGGRSVLRSAAAVEAAALRSLTLGASLPLASLGNPLTRLLDEALDLSGIDQVLGRSPDPAPVRRGTGGRAAPGTRSPATSRPAGVAGIGSAAAAAAGGVGSAMPGGIGTAARAAATALQAAAGVGSSVAAALVPGAPAAASRSAGSHLAGQPAPSHSGSAHAGSARAGVGHSNRAHSASGVQAGAGLDPEQVRQGSSTNALRRAARSTDRTTPAPAPADRPRLQGRELPPRTTTGATSAATSATSAASGQSHAVGDQRSAAQGGAINASATCHPAYPEVPQAAPSRTSELTGGGLAELLARWQDSEPDTLEPPVDTAPVWTPLSSSTFDRERPLRLGDEDRIELALEQILRREVERHGLEGGR